MEESGTNTPEENQSTNEEPATVRGGVDTRTGERCPWCSYTLSPAVGDRAVRLASPSPDRVIGESSPIQDLDQGVGKLRFLSAYFNKIHMF